MRRLKLGVAVGGMVLVLLGVATSVAIRSDSGSNRTETVASQTTVETPTSVDSTLPSSVPAATTATTATKAKSPTTTKKAPATTPTTALKVPTQPTAEDIQKVIAGITAEVLAPANTSASTTPLTKEEVESKVRDQLKQLGITF